jgi:maleate isomerase
MLSGQQDIGVHYSRFALPADLDIAIDRKVLGPAPDLLAEVQPDAVAFHGTSGSWKGLDADRALCAELAEVLHAPATTASLAVVEALTDLQVSRLGLVFPGPRGVADQIVEEYARHHLDILRVAGPMREMGNAEIARLSVDEIEEMALPAFGAEVDAVICIGTNMRSAYRVAEWEQRFGVPVIDSATATLWQLLRLAGAQRSIQGWGGLLAGGEVSVA